MLDFDGQRNPEKIEQQQQTDFCTVLFSDFLASHATVVENPVYF